MKYFLVYTHGVNREDYSTMYCDLVIAEDEADAIKKYCAYSVSTGVKLTPSDFGDDEPESHGIREMDPVV